MILYVSTIKDALKIVEKTPEEIEAIKQEVKKLALSDETITVIIYGLSLILWLPKLILEQKITISRLKELLFGKGHRRRNKKKNKPPNDTSENDILAPVDGDSNAPTPAANENSISPAKLSVQDEPSIDFEKPKGHGRMPHTVYTDAVDHKITIDDLKAGMDCPYACGGNLYDFKPSTIIRIKGQQMACAHRYTVEKLRCNLCGVIITANIPDEVGSEKYDARFKALLALQKYYMAMPSYRQDVFQSFLNVPLPHTTQWYLNEEVAGSALPIFNALKVIAANNDLILFDDTYLKIVDEIKDNRQNPDKKRKGMFTTGILAKSEKYNIILYFNGIKHAGENLDELLSNRTKTKPVILMCDALSRNIPKYKSIIVCLCLSHGFRKFEELLSFYPVPCTKIMKMISSAYKIDKQTINMNDLDRLEHHKKNSSPIMNELHTYLNRLIDEKLVEPNDPLGEAVNYMLKHWHELTQFLRVEGAPLDNNETEQALKIPIRGRKNWMFYKNTYGASIGGVLTSVIYTCMLSDVNPLDYLIAIQENKEQVIKEPNSWLPWTYQGAMSSSLPMVA